MRCATVAVTERSVKRDTVLCLISLIERSVCRTLSAMTTSPTSRVLMERRDLKAGTAVVLTLNRPELRNPLDWSTIKELNSCLDVAIAAPEVRAVILTGTPPAFSAGGDLRGYLDLYKSRSDFRAFLEDIRHLFDRLESSRLLSIAAVNGACVAGGFEMALACDLVLVSERARIGDGHLQFWQLPGGGGSQRLPRAVGSALAKRLFYTQELLSAEAAVRYGLAVEMVEPERLIGRALELAGKVAETPEDTVTTLKHLLMVADAQDLPGGLTAEIDALVDYAVAEGGSAYAGLQRFLDPSRKDGTSVGQ